MHPKVIKKISRRLTNAFSSLVRSGVGARKAGLFEKIPIIATVQHPKLELKSIEPQNNSRDKMYNNSRNVGSLAVQAWPILGRSKAERILSAGPSDTYHDKIVLHLVVAIAQSSMPP